jgi:hypothetical protein
VRDFVIGTWNQSSFLFLNQCGRSLRGISKNKRVTLHVILLGVGGTIYNQYIITPLLNLGIPLHKVHQLATALHCHAIKSLTSSQKQTQYDSTAMTMIIGERMGGYWWLASGGLGTGRIAWLATRQILISLCCFSFFRSLVGLMAS